MKNYYPRKNEKNEFYFVIETGKNAFGKRKRIKRTGFKKRSDALQAMFKLRAELNSSNRNETIY